MGNFRGEGGPLPGRKNWIGRMRAAGRLTPLAAALAAAHATAQVPTGGAVTAGSATISQPTAGSQLIDQSTGRAVIDWQSFSIGRGSSVTFRQPDAASVTLNRVVGGDASRILGSLSAN